jgi:2-polyprenyl-3-methyl-5-hydroxy-6-metoxy-1,4-benzoquinol methylase
MFSVSAQRIWASGAGFGLLIILAVVAQMRDGIPIYAEFGPVEVAEVGFMASLTVLSLRVLFIAENIGPARRWLVAAAAFFAASGINDVVGFTQSIRWIEPFDDLSAIMSWTGALALLAVAVQLRSLPTSTNMLIGTGFVLHIATLVLDLAATASHDGSLANVAELAELSAYATYAIGLSLLVWTVLSPVVADPTKTMWPWPLQYVDACDLCGSTRLSEVVRATAASCRTVLCESCGLLFASPMIHPATLDRFFADGFEGDPGSRSRIAHDDVLERKAVREERFARNWALPVIQRHIDLRGKRVLDIRSRTGTLARAMMEQGADVIGLDPLAPNVDYAREINGLANIRFMPISEIADLRGIPDDSVDAVTVMTVHVLSHLPSPRRLLRRIFDVLRPGGMAFIDEKHALRPVKTAKSSLFGAMPIHSFHFTEDTLGHYVRSAGFEVIECRIDRSRTSAFRHLRIVARKPVDRHSTPWTSRGLPPAKRQGILREIADAQRRLDRRRSLHAARRRAKRLLRRLLT